MTTYREVIYMVFDKLKLTSDDANFTEEHIMFLINKYRPVLLEQKYSDIRNKIPLQNYQTICINMVKNEQRGICVDEYYLRSDKEIPKSLSMVTPSIYPEKFMYNFNMVYIDYNRFSYIGNSKYYRNIIYYTIGPDNYLYMKSSNPQFIHIECIKLNTVFEDAISSYIFNNNNCDITTENIPIEDSLITPLIDIIVQSLLATLYKPEDNQNNSNDDITDVANKLAIAESKRRKKNDE